MEKQVWIDITIDISRLEECRDTIKIILDTVASFSIIDLPSSLFCAYWQIGEAIKWLKVLNGDTTEDDLLKMRSANVYNICET
jgi:hypothetical protein